MTRTTLAQPILHPRTKANLEAYITAPTHGLALVGEEGSGKYYIATWLAEQLEANMHTIQAEADKSTISIDQIRQLYTLTRSSTPLLIVIKEAGQLSQEAQNAFLKLLEEPPTNTNFILTVEKSTDLLQTIWSRLQVITILPPTTLLKQLPSDALADEVVRSLTFTLSRTPGALVTSLNDEDSRLTHLGNLSQAKQFYSSQSYTRLLMLHEQSYDKVWSQQLLKNVAMIIHTLLKNSVANGSVRPTLSSQALLIEEVYQAIIIKPGNPKLHLSRLALEL